MQGRNRKVIEKINGYLKDVEVNYERDAFLTLQEPQRDISLHTRDGRRDIGRKRYILGRYPENQYREDKGYKNKKRMDFRIIKENALKYGGPGYTPRGRPSAFMMRRR